LSLRAPEAPLAGTFRRFDSCQAHGPLERRGCGRAGGNDSRKFTGARYTDRAPGKAIQLFGQGLIVETRSGLPGELFGMISVIVHEAALSAVAMMGTPGVSM
jgi:hypothetical protein